MVWIGKNGLALALSVVVHGVMFLSLARWGPAETFPVLASPPGVMVELVGRPGAVAERMPESEEPSSKSLFEEIRTSMASEEVAAKQPDVQPKRSSVSELFREVSETAGGKPSSPTGPAASSPAGAAPSGGYLAQASVPRSGGGRETGDCWKRTERPVAVKMMITVDSSGGLVAAPTIVRPRNVKLDASRLSEEALARDAMMGCAPYPLITPAGRYQRLELDFSKRGAWVSQAGTVVID